MGRAGRCGGGVGGGAEEKERGKERRQETGGAGKESILNFISQFTFFWGAGGVGWGEGCWKSKSDKTWKNVENRQNTKINMENILW